MRQLEVQIMGQSYLLTCPGDGEARLREAVAKVDEAMCGIRDLGKVKARDRIAVLAALNLTFELMQALADRAAAAPLQALPPEGPEAPPAPQAAQAQGSAPQVSRTLPSPPISPTSPAPQKPGQPPSQPQGKADEAISKAPHPQLQTLLQRLNTALGASNSRPD